jgi:hypothetical protein
MVGITGLLLAHAVELVSLVPGVRTFSAVICTDKDWNELDMLACFQ